MQDHALLEVARGIVVVERLLEREPIRAVPLLRRAHLGDIEAGHRAEELHESRGLAGVAIGLPFGADRDPKVRGLVELGEGEGDLLAVGEAKMLRPDVLRLRLGARQRLARQYLSTEQRFFGYSIPHDVAPEDWEHVTIRQAAADHHRIVSALREFYEGAWLSTGHSKGGMTSIYHRRFYPDDVDATVAYVAPISYDIADPRYLDFVNGIGEATCRETLRALQREALERFEVLRPRAEQEAPQWDMIFERTDGHARAFEIAIAAMEWNFWKRSGLASCDELPELETVAELDDDALYAVIREHAGLGWTYASPRRMEPYYYQATRELGWPRLPTEHLEDRLQFEDIRDDVFQLANGLPAGVERPAHDPESMADIQDWFLDDASEILLVYGEYDSWTGGAFATRDGADTPTYYAPAANHRALLRDLTAADLDDALDAIQAWIGARPDIVTGDHAPRVRAPAHLGRLGPHGF